MSVPDFNTFVHPNNWMLTVALSLYIIAILLFEIFENKTYSLLALFLGSISFFSYVALSYPFLHVWDEQFHALVAKNMGNDFFTPVLLKDPIIEYNNIWRSNHIWLHKQPFFLWQMALSLKLFGANTFALRIPDILMSSLMPILIYRIGKIIKNNATGFYAGLLFLASSFLMTLISGSLNTDHNDLAFIFYITASFWAWFEYKRSKHVVWLYAIGLFSGIAILIKWLVGLLVYSGWGLTILADAKQRFNPMSWIDILKSLGITLFVALPWQIYILLRFPIEANREYAYNTLHFSKVIEGHGGEWNYHIQQWALHIAPYFDWIVPISILIFVFLKIRKQFKIAIIAWILITTIFYSMAATKMPGFTLILTPLFFILIIAPWDELLLYFKNKLPKNLHKFLIPILRSGFLVIAFYYLFSLDTLKNNPPWKKDVWKKNYTEALIFKKIDTLKLMPNARFYNFYFFGDVRFMFHTHYQARAFLPTEDQIETLKDQGIIIYIFDDTKLPAYILQDTSITKIKSPIWPESKTEDLEFYK